MKRSYRDNKPRFHKHRQGKMLLPHNQLSGLFFTVNPRQESRAQREAQLYLSTLTRDLEAGQDAFARATSGTAATEGTRDGVALSDGAESAAPTAPTASASLSSLLAAELAACSTQDQRGNRYNAGKRPRSINEDDDDDASGVVAEGDSDADEGDGDNNGGAARKRRDAPQRRSEWFAPLETGCKGYLFLNVPAVNVKVTCPTCHAGSSVPQGTAAMESGVPDDAQVPAVEGQTASNPSGVVPHTIVFNPLVSRITERIFDDLDANPRPIFRNCFRLMPAELTCCPTLPEMQTALRELLSLHFAPATTSGDAVSAGDPVDFHQPIPLPSWGPDQPRRSMHTVALQLTVKNNTNVEKKKASILSALTAAIPANRFIVVGQPSSKTKCVVEATVCIFVAHATCVMGLQRRVTERRGFNLHAVGEDAFVLSNSVTGATSARMDEEPAQNATA